VTDEVAVTGGVVAMTSRSQRQAGYGEENRRAWNEAAPRHRAAKRRDYGELFRRPGFSTLDQTFTSLVRGLPVGQGPVAHLCCNDGRELLSLVNTMGVPGVGFDISDEFIADARRTAQAAGLGARFIRTDILEIGARFDHTFTLAFFTAGSLAFFEDVGAALAVAARLLRPGGHLLVYEVHPFATMLASPAKPASDCSDPYHVTHAYFREAAWVEREGMDYVGETTYESKPFVSFSHTLGTVVDGAAGAGLGVVSLREYPHDVTRGFACIENDGIVPLSYALVARKDAGRPDGASPSRDAPTPERGG
jgi:SAM-dependent methyltransferase